MREDEADDLLDALELRALDHAAAHDEAEEEPRLAASLAADAPVSDRDASAAEDITLAGYVARHNRVPAFEGADGQPYTVDIDVAEEDGGFVAFLVFLRWAETGAGIMGHLESGDVATGASEADARRAAMELSLYEVKAELDAAIARRGHELSE